VVLGELDLPASSMRPKAEAAAAFAEYTGAPAAVGPLDDALGTILGTTGTTVRAAPDAGRPGPKSLPKGPSALGRPASPTAV
jgi:carbamate kinase